MKEWLKISMVLCVFGFFKEFRPSEYFILEYMSERGTDVDEVYRKILPVGTYTYLAHLLVVFLVADYLRYKPLIILSGFCGIICWGIVGISNRLVPMQISKVFFGIFQSCEVAYYTYIYAKVDDEHYLQVSSYTRAAVLAGRSLSGAMAQLMASLELLNYVELNAITIVAMGVAASWAFFLPSVDRRVLFDETGFTEVDLPGKFQVAFTFLKNHLRSSLGNTYVLKWSLWWSLSSAGFTQVYLYAQSLWEEILVTDADTQLYNGAVEAVSTLLGFLTAILAAYLKVDWKTKGDLILAIHSIMAGGFIVVCSQTDYLLVNYICYSLFCSLYQFMATIASSEIANGIADDSYGLVFGVNSFLGLVVQTMITLIFVEESSLSFTPKNQFLVYAIYHFLIAIIYIAITLVALRNRILQNNKAITEVLT